MFSAFNLMILTETDSLSSIDLSIVAIIFKHHLLVLKSSIMASMPLKGR